MRRLSWVFDPIPPSGARSGGLASSHVFDPSLDTFVREVLQNSRDQRRSNQSVHVQFTFDELTGKYKDDFLEALLWNDLKLHIRGGAEDGGITISHHLKHALEIADKRPLLLLRIDDTGTYGLTGSETDRSGNFVALCKSTLVTNESRQRSGGSFGIGKSVLWRFSDFSTVLFSSRVVDDPRTGFRLFGRSELPFHRACGQEWQGPGWFGLEETATNGRLAVSVWDEQAISAAQALGLYRSPQDGTGTSILVIGFFEPNREEQRSVREIAEDLLMSSVRWFWPSMYAENGPDLHVSVAARKNGTEIFRQDAELTEEVYPFVSALSSDVTHEDTLASPGDVAERHIPFAIPRRETTPDKDPHEKTQAHMRLRVRAADAGETHYPNTIALVRGSGMVVKYFDGKSPFGEKKYHGVLLAGTANDDSEESRRLEMFLRASEPPSHNNWIGSTDRLHAEYARGAQAELNRLWARLDTSVLSLFNTPPSDYADGAPALARMLPMPGKGGGMVTRDKFRVSSITAEFVDSVWSFSGKIRCSRPEHGWVFTVVPRLDSESGGRTVLRIKDFLADGIRMHQEGNTMVCSVPPRVGMVEFHGEAVADTADISAEDLRRVGFTLQIKGKAQGS